MKTFLISIVLIGCANLAVIGQNKSIYTSTNEKACKTLESTDDGAGSYVGECKGVGGYKLHLIEGDIRQTIDIIAPNKDKFELNFWSFYGGFSSVGETVEWRLKKGVPVALIARYNVANPEGTGNGTSYLIVSKITKGIACVTGVVAPGKGQNLKARKLADAATDQPCKPTE